MDTTVTGSLIYGVPFEGRLHREFTMRLPAIGDNIAAVEAYPDGSNMRLELAIYARCLHTLGEIPQSAITIELLQTGLQPEDFEVMGDALMAVKKKRKAASADLPLTGS